MMFAAKKRKLDSTDKDVVEIINTEELELENKMNEIYMKFEKKELTRNDIDLLFNHCRNVISKYKNAFYDLRHLNSNSNAVNITSSASTTATTCKPTLTNSTRCNGKQIQSDNAVPALECTDWPGLLEEFHGEQLITDFEDLKSISPRIRLYIGIYASYMTLMQQTKVNRQAKGDMSTPYTIIPYREIQQIILVPDTSKEIVCYVQLRRRIALGWKKEYLEYLLIRFSDERDYKDAYEIQPYKQNTNLPEIMKGTMESVFAELMEQLGKIPIIRPDVKLFQLLNKKKQTQYVVKGHIGSSPINIYPLEQGMFMESKPVLILDKKQITGYSFPRGLTSCSGQTRFFDLQIHTNLENSRSKNNCKMFNISMIDTDALYPLEKYFLDLGIKNTQLEAQKEAISQEKKEQEEKIGTANGNKKDVEMKEQNINRTDPKISTSATPQELINKNCPEETKPHINENEKKAVNEKQKPDDHKNKKTVFKMLDLTEENDGIRRSARQKNKQQNIDDQSNKVLPIKNMPKDESWLINYDSNEDEVYQPNDTDNESKGTSSDEDQPNSDRIIKEINTLCASSEKKQEPLVHTEDDDNGNKENNTNNNNNNNISSNKKSRRHQSKGSEKGKKTKSEIIFREFSIENDSNNNNICKESFSLDIKHTDPCSETIGSPRISGNSLEKDKNKSYESNDTTTTSSTNQKTIHQYF